MNCYLLRKHPPHPFQRGYMGGGPAHLEAFTIEGVFTTHAEAANIAKAKNKRSTYLYTVKRFTGPKDKTP